MLQKLLLYSVNSSNSSLLKAKTSYKHCIYGTKPVSKDLKHST